MEQVAGFDIYFDNLQEFRGLRREIFDHHVYYFETEKKDPLIVDLGAHIGLATLYFKKLYPDSIIAAIEPNPYSRKYLEQNIEVNRLENVQVMPFAIADQSGQAQFYMDASPEHWNSNASFIEKGWDKTQNSQSMSVETLRLDEIINMPVDFLKMDIEGSEGMVLKTGTKALEFVDHLLFEYHPIQSNNLPDLIELLHDNHFTTTIYKNGTQIDLERARGLLMVEGKKGKAG